MTPGLLQRLKGHEWHSAPDRSVWGTDGFGGSTEMPRIWLIGLS
jgi:hypothetical protein